MDEERRLRVLGFAGSLRKGSYNRALIEAAGEVAPRGMALEPYDLSPIPLYNEDVRAEGMPPAVEAFRAAIAGADALLIATPEYNYSIPGVLKNAIDWASRPPDQPFDGKPVALVGASPSRLGTARAQYHLRQCFVYLNGFVLNQSEILVANASALFDENGRLTDEATRARLGELLAALREAVLRQVPAR